MNDPEMHAEFDAFLAARKHPLEPQPGFSDRVLATVTAWEKSRAPVPGPKASAPLWREALRRFGFAGFGRRTAWAVAAMLIVCAPLSILVRHPAVTEPGSGSADSTRIKGGGFRLDFLVKRGNRIEPALPGQAFFPGDRLQAVYSSPFSGTLQLFSLSRNGEVTCLSCQAPSDPLVAGQAKPLPYALELDSGEVDEAMIGLLTESPLARDASARALAAAWEQSDHDFGKIGARLKSLLPVRTEVSVFPIRKKHEGKKI